MSKSKNVSHANHAVPDPSEAAYQMRRLLEFVASESKTLTKGSIFNGRFIDSVFLSALNVSLCINGRIICSFIVPPHLTDEDGNWATGAIAALIDGLGAVTIKTVDWHVGVSVDLSISYFSTAKINIRAAAAGKAEKKEEVEIDAKVVGDKGNPRVTSVVVDIRKKDGGVLVASGRLWMTSAKPRPRNKL